MECSIHHIVKLISTTLHGNTDAHNFAYANCREIYERALRISKIHLLSY